MKEPKPQAQSQTYVMENPLRSPKVFKGIMCQSPNKIPWKQVFIFMDLGLFLWIQVFLKHVLSFTAQRPSVSIDPFNGGSLQNQRRGGDRRKGLTEKSMFFLSWLTARGSGMGSACLITDTDSPAETREGDEPPVFPLQPPFNAVMSLHHNPAAF